MNYDGPERRKNGNYCQQHIDFVENMAVIKQAVIDIKETITEGINFKRGIVTTLISVGVILLLQIGAFAYFYGQLNKQVEINTARLGVLENTINAK